MVMPLSGTFAYSTTVPVDSQNAFPWQMKSLEPFARSGDPFVDKRLVGWSPLLYVREAGLPPNPMPSVPSVERSEIRLVATDKKYASCEAAFYFVDRVLLRVLRPGDVFHIARTCCGGVGVSAIREWKLVFAVGAVGAVPLGSAVRARGSAIRSQKEGQTMIRRLSLLLLLSMVVIVDSAFVRPARSANQERTAQEHIAWVHHTLEKMETIKPGMMRFDLLKVFRTEGGLSTGLRRTFVSQDCPYFKVDVEFKVVARADSDNAGVVTLLEDNRDIIVKISKPYLQFTIAD